MIRGLDPKFQVVTAVVTRTAGDRSSLVSRRTPAVRVGGALPLGPAAPALPVMGSGPASPPADPPPQGGLHTALLAVRSLLPKEKQRDGVVQSPHPGPVCAGQGCAQQDRCRLRGVPWQSVPPRLLCIPLGVRERNSPRELEKTGVGGPSGAAAGSKETLEDTLLPRRFPESKPHCPEGGPQRKLLPRLPENLSLSVWLNQTHHFPAQSLPSAA